MTGRSFQFLFLACPALVSAATLRVGPGEAFSAVQNAIDAALPGDTIQVSPGLYRENLVVSKAPLTLTGARAADDARGRVDGLPDPLVESIISPTTGKALELASADGSISVSGFSFIASVPVGAGVVCGDSAPLTSFSFLSNHVVVASGSAGAAMFLNRDAIDATITGNVFLGSAESVATVDLAGENQFHGLRFEGNHVIRDGPIGNTGFRVDGDHNLGPSQSRGPLIQGNLFRNHAIGFFGGARSLQNVEIADNTFNGNEIGMAAGPHDSQVHGNEWSDNPQCGLKLSSFGNSSDPSQGARDNVIENNRFLNNGGSGSPSGHADLCFDPQAAGTQGSNIVRLNRMTSPAAIFDADPSSTIQAAFNYWGAPDGPGETRREAAG